MQTAHQLMIRDALISARERFRSMIEEDASPAYAGWVRKQAKDGLNDADKALSILESDNEDQ